MLNCILKITISAPAIIHQNLGFCTQILQNLPKTSRASTTPIIKHFTPCFSSERKFHNSAKLFQEISSLQIKKRPIRKKILPQEELAQLPGTYNIVAFSTAQEYNLEDIVRDLKIQSLYEPKQIDNLPDVVHAVARNDVSKEPSEIFFFREGSVVFWNITDQESSNMVKFLKGYEEDRYSDKLVQEEVELMKYRHKVEGKSIIIQTTGELHITPRDNLLEKYTFSNTLASSVKLGIWEASLDRFIDSIEYITDDLKRGAKIKMSIEEVLTKHGELYGLKHLVNLSSELLDTPDFYWDHEELEHLYLQGYAYFSIGRRTKVINDKINHCIELIELLSRHLSDRHHIRLEWMVIILIMMEVLFEVVHYVERSIA